MKYDYDYIITGGGSAGCVLAGRLTENPSCSVLLLEAGGSDEHFMFHWPAGFARMTRGIASWGWSTVAQKQMQDRVLWYTQAKVIGGGSTINAQIYTRGNRMDYDRWRDTHNCSGWGYEDVLPYFKRAEDNDIYADEYHGQDGPLGVSTPCATLPVCDAFIRAGQEFGIPFNHDFNGKSQEGIGFYQLTQRNCRRSSAATAYLGSALGRENLTILTNAKATRIIVENGVARSLEVRRNQSLETFNANSEIIVTAGSIGSPCLLMLSGIGPAEYLHDLGIGVKHDLPGVGNNLQDHLDICVISECKGDYSYDRIARPHRSVWAGLQYLLFKSGPVASSLFETGGFWYSDENVQSPDIQFHFGQGSGIEKGVLKLDNPGVTLNSALVRPDSRGTVRLASADPDATPLIDPDYWSEPQDLERSLKGLEMAREIMLQPAFKRFIKREALPGAKVQAKKELLNYACRMAKTDHHPVGTCKMGNDDMAVVTPNLKVRGLDGIRICDASIMPSINSSNTNATTIMIAEKASDLIQAE